MSIVVSFPGGVRVDASFRGNTVQTDQPEPVGQNSAMSPFDLFLASIATCMGFYALRFCQERALSTDGLALTLNPVRDPATKRLTTIQVHLQAPAGFPDKYEKALHRAVDQCAVKKALSDPPEFDIEIAL
jgi:ribosomal protein S12 methylthiotransferase accessory factor